MASEPARSRALGLIPEEILAHVPGFTRGGTAWALRLPGGTVNASFRVDTSAGRFVVRIHDAAAATLGADHEREARLHAAAAAVGLAPALIHVNESYRFMIMEHVAGPTWAADDFGRPERLGQLGAALHVLHTVSAPAVTPFDIETSLGRHYERLRAALPAEATQLGALMDRAREALRASETARRAKTVVHNDLHHTNLIGTDRLFLLDWEYGAVTDPLLDLACVLAYYPQAGAHVDALLDSSRLGAVATPEMLVATTWLCGLLSYFWYRTRRVAGPVSAADLAAEQGLLDRLG
jgi:aminoglycoside phosphotransferase (APT) family kinase protein